MAHPPAPGPPPLFSVVIPVYDRPEPLRKCLEGLAALRFPRDRFEVIVSDDGSPVVIEPMAVEFHDRFRVTVVRHPNGGPGAARNRGVSRAQGRYLAFIDSDCIPAPDWLQELERRFTRTPDHLICGGIVNALPANLFSEASQLIVTYVHQYYAERHGDRFFNSTNIALPTARFLELGGFDESLRTSEDYDFCHRWQQGGFEISHVPEAVVYHAHDLTFTGFCRQHFRYGRGLFRWRLGMARRSGKGLSAQPAGFYLQLLRFPLRGGLGSRGWLLALLVALSQAAIASGVLRELLNQAWQAMISRGPGSRGATSAHS